MKLERVAQEWAEYEAMSAARRHSSLRREARPTIGESRRAPAGIGGRNDFYARKASKVARTGRLLRERVLDRERK